MAASRPPWNSSSRLPGLVTYIICARPSPSLLAGLPVVVHNPHCLPPPPLQPPSLEPNLSPACGPAPSRFHHPSLRRNTPPPPGPSFGGPLLKEHFLCATPSIFAPPCHPVLSAVAALVESHPTAAQTNNFRPSHHLTSCLLARTSACRTRPLPSNNNHRLQTPLRQTFGIRNRPLVAAAQTTSTHSCQRQVYPEKSSASTRGVDWRQTHVYLTRRQNRPRALLRPPERGKEVERLLPSRALAAAALVVFLPCEPDPGAAPGPIQIGEAQEAHIHPRAAVPRVSVSKTCCQAPHRQLVTLLPPPLIT